jgi:hypothetical protein
MQKNGRSVSAGSLGQSLQGSRGILLGQQLVVARKAATNAAKAATPWVEQAQGLEDLEAAVDGPKVAVHVGKLTRL